MLVIPKALKQKRNKTCTFFNFYNTSISVKKTKPCPMQINFYNYKYMGTLNCEANFEIWQKAPASYRTNTANHDTWIIISRQVPFINITASVTSNCTLQYYKL